jgi:hypothetical protein
MENNLSPRQFIGFGMVTALSKLQELIYTVLIRDKVWRSFDGTVTPVRQMSDSHLINARNMVARRDGRSDSWRMLQDEIERRAKIANKKPKTRTDFQEYEVWRVSNDAGREMSETIDATSIKQAARICRNRINRRTWIEYMLPGDRYIVRSKRDPFQEMLVYEAPRMTEQTCRVTRVR